MKSHFARFTVGFALLGAGFISAPAQAEASGHSVDQAYRITSDIEGTARNVATLLAKARRTNDKRAIACVNESLSEADAVRRRARQRIADLRADMERGDAHGEERAATTLVLLARDRDTARAVSKEAFACVGVTLHRAGERDMVTVRVFIDRDIPPDDE